MARTLSGAMQAQLAGAAIAPILFVELLFPGGPVRMWSGLGSIAWDSKTWLGTGELLGISSIEETSAVESTSATITLSGIPSSMVSAAYNEFAQGRPARVWLGLLVVETGAVVADPVQIFGGRMDVIADQDSGETATISVTAESNLADLSRLRVRFFTDTDQQRFFEGDRSLRFVASIQDRPIYWAQADKPGLPQAVR